MLKMLLTMLNIGADTGTIFTNNRRLADITLYGLKVSNLLILYSFFFNVFGVATAVNDHKLCSGGNNN